jgi:DNA-binding transcriptional MerR regulator|tara:strand:- start:571 stop:894 length:324 start_codon:yes stop_codon:yes gene_type:complete
MKINLQEKRYYSIGEVASKFNVNPSLIRFWEQEFKLLNPKKNSRGNRKFTNTDIENINKIYFLLKEKGFTIQGAKDYIRNEKTSKKLDIVSKLKQIKDRLIEIRDQL